MAGKTGTAESGSGKPHAWFAGYSPADTPEIVITVLLENAGEGSKEAAPLFRLMLESYYGWLNK
jgi:peptidoglycan glycosyltransferase